MQAHVAFLRTLFSDAKPDTPPLLEKVEIPMKFRDGIYFFSNRDEIRDKKSS
jgi:hypothetical protein